MLREWVEGYVGAWSSNDADEIGALFAEDAVYFTEPYAEPWRGREAIVAKWLEARDEAGTWTFDWQPLLETPELSIVTGTTIYKEPPRVYSTLWVIRLDPDGTCREFTEWWMEHRPGT
jgi:ketosteroid isomerase-like protein